MIDENYVRETIEAYIKTIDRENSTLEVSFLEVLLQVYL